MRAGRPGVPPGRCRAPVPGRAPDPAAGERWGAPALRRPPRDDRSAHGGHFRADNRRYDIIKEHHCIRSHPHLAGPVRGRGRVPVRHPADAVAHGRRATPRVDVAEPDEQVRVLAAGPQEDPRPDRSDDLDVGGEPLPGPGPDVGAAFEDPVVLRSGPAEPGLRSAAHGRGRADRVVAEAVRTTPGPSATEPVPCCPATAGHTGVAHALDHQGQYGRPRLSHEGEGA